jgi:hypothetical protein
VVARAAGGIPEVAGDAALLLADEPPDLAVVAELLELAAGDAELRGQRRLERYAFEETAAALRGAVERVAR